MRVRALRRDLLKKVSLKAPRLRYLRSSSSANTEEFSLDSAGEVPKLCIVDVLVHVHCPSMTIPGCYCCLCFGTSTIPDRGLRNYSSRITFDARFAPLLIAAAFLCTITSPLRVPPQGRAIPSQRRAVIAVFIVKHTIETHPAMHELDDVPLTIAPEAASIPASEQHRENVA